MITSAAAPPSWSSGSARWKGSWIGPEARPSADPFGTPIGGTTTDGRFSRSIFRKSFHLDEVPSIVPARLTADARYVLWVNGTEVGRGPARSQPMRQRYDEYDLAPLLVPGDNALAVLVTYYGTATSFWQPAPAGASPDAVLVFEAELADGTAVVSDVSWRVQRSPAWTLAAGDGIHGVPVEILDSRELPAGWRERAFDDSGWPDAAVLATTHIGGLAQSRPPTYPFGRLQPRRISHLAGERVVPARILDFSARSAPTWSDGHPAHRVTQALLQDVVDAGRVSGDEPAATPLRFDLNSDRVHHIGLDFGRVVAGFVEVEITAPRGTRVELFYREKMFRPELAGTGLDPETGARFVCAGGTQVFEAVELNGLRYLHLVVHGPDAGAVTVAGIAVREHLYPRTGDAYFRCDDPGLEALYRAGVRTVELNSFDAYTDCPTREQRAWVGDGVVHQQVDLTTNADWGLARNYLELGDSPRPDGILPMVVAGEVEAGGGLTIPDWSLSWTHGVYLQYRYDGDLEAMRRRLPTFERILRWFGDYRDTRSTIADVPEWNLVDWSSIFLTGRSSILTGLWARALAEFAELAAAADNPGAAGWARALHAAAAEGYQDFWDAARGLYIDHIVDGRPMPAASQAAGAVAILSGLAPRDRWTSIVDAITDPDRLVVRSWIGSDTGGYDVQKIVEQSRGVQRIDWDPQHQIVLAEPFFSYAVHDAVALAGHADRLPALLDRWHQFLVDGYDTFGECWGWGTPVHGWSSTPTRDLVVHVLGISPDAPGYARGRVAPRLGRLREAAGAVPTPHGTLEVRVGGGEARIHTPVPVVVVHENGHETLLPAGSHSVPVRDV